MAQCPDLLTRRGQAPDTTHGRVNLAALTFVDTKVHISADITVSDSLRYRGHASSLLIRIELIYQQLLRH